MPRSSPTVGSGRGIPPDARSKPGSGGQLIAFVPSLDLVVTRQTGSSGGWEYEEFLRRACAAVVKAPRERPVSDVSSRNVTGATGGGPDVVHDPVQVDFFVSPRGK